MGKKIYSVTYRGEFTADIEAESEEEAIKKFNSGKEEIILCGDLWEEYFEVEGFEGAEE